MLVTTYKDERSHTGLFIGEANVRRYFRKRRPSIELRLDDLHIQCALGPEFWRDHPEIHDPRLSTWLEFKAGRRRVGSDPMEMELVPSGAGRFVVRPQAPRYQGFGAEVAMPPKRETHDSLRSATLASQSVA